MPVSLHPRPSPRVLSQHPLSLASRLITVHWLRPLLGQGPPGQHPPAWP